MDMVAYFGEVRLHLNTVCIDSNFVQRYIHLYYQTLNGGESSRDPRTFATKTVYWSRRAVQPRSELGNLFTLSCKGQKGQGIVEPDANVSIPMLLLMCLQL